MNLFEIKELFNAIIFSDEDLIYNLKNLSLVSKIFYDNISAIKRESFIKEYKNEHFKMMIINLPKKIKIFRYESILNKSKQKLIFIPGSNMKPLKLYFNFDNNHISTFIYNDINNNILTANLVVIDKNCRMYDIRCYRKINNLDILDIIMYIYQYEYEDLSKKNPEPLVFDDNKRLEIMKLIENNDGGIRRLREYFVEKEFIKMIKN